MSSVKTVLRDPDSKKRRILEAARRLLIKRGFQDIVLDDVAHEAGVAKGTLFLYFKSKDELFAAAMADLVDGLGLELEALAKTGLKSKDMLLTAAKVILTHFDHSRDFMAHLRIGGKIREKILANHARVRALIALASSDEARSIPDPDFAAAVFIGLCRSAATRKVITGHDMPLEREADRIVAFFLTGSGVTL